MLVLVDELNVNKTYEQHKVKYGLFKGSKACYSRRNVIPKCVF